MLSLTLSGRMLFLYLAGAEKAENRMGSSLALTANTAPTSIRRVLHHGLHILRHTHHSHPKHWLLRYDISFLLWLTSHIGIGWAEVINIEENFNRWTFAVNTRWLTMDLLVLPWWFSKWLITSIWPLIAQSDSQFCRKNGVETQLWCLNGGCIPCFWLVWVGPDWAEWQGNDD